MEKRHTSDPVRIVQRRWTEEERAKHDDDVIVIRGYGAIFYDGTPETEYKLWDGAVERIMPGAFDKTLEESPDVLSMFNHDDSQVLGRTSAGTMRLFVDERGLAYETDLPKSDIGQRVGEAIGRRDVKGSSFMFNIPRGGEEWIEEGDLDVRNITRVDPLFETGPVTFPAYESATTGIKASGDNREARESHERWKAVEAEAEGKSNLEIATATRDRRLRIVEA